MNAPEDFADAHLGARLKRKCLMLAVECVGTLPGPRTDDGHAKRSEGLGLTEQEDHVCRFLERAMLAHGNIVDEEQKAATKREPRYYAWSERAWLCFASSALEAELKHGASEDPCASAARRADAMLLEYIARMPDNDDSRSELQEVKDGLIEIVEQLSQLEETLAKIAGCVR